MLVYCNDNKVRLCHICGAMKKFSWLAVGDLVLVSLRDFEKKPEAGSKEYEKGDILAKYDQDHIGKLKKMPDINPKLFMQLETMDGKILAEIGDKESSKMTLPGEDDNLGIEFDRSGADEKEEGEDEDSKNSDIEIDDI